MHRVYIADHTLSRPVLVRRRLSEDGGLVEGRCAGLTAAAAPVILVRVAGADAAAAWGEVEWGFVPAGGIPA